LFVWLVWFVVEKKRRILNHGQHEPHEREREEDERM
jgi:hypothetical protein